VTVIILPSELDQKRTRPDDVARCGSTVLFAASAYNLSDLMAGPILSFGFHHACGSWPPVPRAGTATSIAARLGMYGRLRIVTRRRRDREALATGHCQLAAIAVLTTACMTE
jgi:hypothetical protein